MKELKYEQGSVAWLNSRACIPTASEFKSLITPKWEVRKWSTEMPNTYLARKLAERWLGGALAGYNSFDMDAGHILEEEARPWASLELNVDFRQAGLCTTDDGSAGCSPDGLIGDTGIGIEIKSPQPPAHVKYLLDGNVPEEYLAQVHGSMFITGAPHWWFLSYGRRFPNLLIRVMRDEDIISVIRSALAEFTARSDYGFERMKQLYGGPPPNFQRTFQSMADTVQQANELVDDAFGITP